MPSNPADHSGHPRRRIARQQSEDTAALEELLADARPEPSLPRDLVYTICTRATRQRELRQLWKARLAVSAVVVLLLVLTVRQLPQREDPAVRSVPAPAPAHFGPPSGSSDRGSSGSQWDWNAPGAVPSGAMTPGELAPGAAAADAEYIDRVLNNRRRAGDRLRSGEARLP